MSGEFKLFVLADVCPYMKKLAYIYSKAAAGKVLLSIARTKRKKQNNICSSFFVVCVVFLRKSPSSSVIGTKI